MREPTVKEREQLSQLLGQDSVIDELPITVFDGGRTKDTENLAAPVGLPGRREFVIGSDFLAQDDEFVRAILTLQASRLQVRLYDKRFVAALLRLEVLLVLLVYFLPPVPPAPTPQLGTVTLVGSVVLLVGIEHWARSAVYESDRHAAAKSDAERIERGLVEYANRINTPQSRSRLEEFFDLSPSIENRVVKLQSYREMR